MAARPVGDGAQPGPCRALIYMVSAPAHFANTAGVLHFFLTFVLISIHCNL